ncbi:hypothetical protein MNBD_GAMMA15-298 [hydrothermal vent metagenome]|uniref:PpiC domain-containing protein n=1 Tax=hydrothermal vent metagenome TaxID=652676 RepID=A0A3B0YV56_9ZZZZ
MKLRYMTLALVLAGSLTACDQLPSGINGDANKTARPPADDSEVLATVNGMPITANTLEIYQQHRQGRAQGNPAAPDRKAMLEEIINLELASQDGEKKGVDKKPEIYAQIEQQRRAVVASAAFQRQMKKHPISEEELKSIYDEKTQASNEYKARHILVDSKEKAEILIAELDKGADFAEVAMKNSTGPSGKNGGDLGWFSPQSMVKPFSQAIIGMDKGSYTPEPVKTQFGWHIIKLEDSRESTPPAFEQVKPQLEMMVRNQRVQDYINKLRKKANIQIMETEPAPEVATEDAAAEDTAATSEETPAAKEEATTEDAPKAE